MHMPGNTFYGFGLPRNNGRLNQSRVFCGVWFKPWLLLGLAIGAGL